MFSGSGFGEEGVERVIGATNGLVRRHLAVGLDAMLKAIGIKMRVNTTGRLTVR